MSLFLWWLKNCVKISHIDRHSLAKKHQVKTIFFEELVSPKISETIAKEIGAQTKMLNPLEGLSDEELKAGADYFSVMESNLETLVEALNQ